MSSMLRDLRHAIRVLVKTPGFTAVAVLSLALGIGAGTAVFSLVNAVLLQSLPTTHPERLRTVKWAGRAVHMTSFSGNASVDGDSWTDAEVVPYQIFLRLREQTAGKADVFGFSACWPTRWPAAARTLP